MTESSMGGAADAAGNSTYRPKPIAIVAALVAAAVIIMLPTPEGLTPVGQRTAALFIAALILWSTEAIPIAVTSLLAIVIQPLLAISELGPAMSASMSPVFFFVLVMFIIALAWTKTGLARRFALWMLSKAGNSSTRAVYVFVFGTGALSMIVSDVPAAAIFLAIALGIFAKLGLEPGQGSRFGKAIMLGIPIAALIGGVGTPAGSSINLLGLEIIVQQGGERIAFVEWMAIGVPMVLILLPVAAWVLLKFFPPEFETIGALQDIEDDRKAMGPISAPEWKLMILMGTMLTLWILSSWPELFPAPLRPLSNIFLVAVLGGCVMFMPGMNFFTWKEAQRATGWEVLLLLFAVTSMGAVSSSSGLAQWLVDVTLGDVAGWHMIWILAVISIFTVVIHLMLPIAPVINAVMIPPIMILGTAAGFDPVLFALPVIFTASCAFLLPLDAVPLVTFGKGYYKMFDMLAPGTVISIVWVILMTALMLIMGPIIGLL
jgi:solute carrier family 13 (sodium-dependent dicarboxylate transporter), member 2/3/5